MVYGWYMYNLWVIYGESMDNCYGFLVRGWGKTPLKNMVRQLGWWHSQLNGKIKVMFQTTNQVLYLFVHWFTALPRNTTNTTLLWRISSRSWILGSSSPSPDTNGHTQNTRTPMMVPFYAHKLPMFSGIIRFPSEVPSNPFHSSTGVTITSGCEI